MADSVHVTTTTDQKPAILALVRNLPGILSGRVADLHSISSGFKSRIGYAILSLIAPNFEELGRGQTGADGDKWPPLSKEYLAYGRRFGPGEQAALRKQAGVSKQHRHAPGDKKGLLTPDQLKLWRRTYADRLAWYMMRESDEKAKAHAAAIAWVVVKKAGAKTKIDTFGNRVVQILVDTGRGRGSLQPGVVYDSGPAAVYHKPGGKGSEEQVFEQEPSRLIVGTNVGYMGAHHRGKASNPKNKLPTRRLWPREFPSDWWQQILGAGISGLTRIVELLGGGRGL